MINDGANTKTRVLKIGSFLILPFVGADLRVALFEPCPPNPKVPYRLGNHSSIPLQDASRKPLIKPGCMNKFQQFPVMAHATSRSFCRAYDGYFTPGDIPLKGGRDSSSWVFGNQTVKAVPTPSCVSTSMRPL